MSNIERKYSYHDNGVLPTTGEYGITYLTLYSSGAGNIYDGWIYDPDNKIPVSATERSFGFRNPTYPQYCWDDEVVVDLSNAQNREEASESVQGRITSFNTNVSDLPIVLQDIDTSEMSESEREAAATTVLFTAIPLVKDAYIQAMIEVQCKVNLSQNNTDGMVRIEAFYILNDESDRTMRPNPVHTFMVGTENERHTLPWLYWNPTLKHETNNYIGVKLIATGGTAEIGISDNPEYGDAMITLTSGGLNGDIIYSGQPVSLEIFGMDEVPIGYRLNPDDYTVLCTYDTGEIYDVTKLCAYNPEMWTEIEEAETTLTATYQGLTASMLITVDQVDHIELLGTEVFHGSYELNLGDYTVLAYTEFGDVVDITDKCTYSPAMGTVLTDDAVLTATFTMSENAYTDSLSIEAIKTPALKSVSSDGLTYTLYDGGLIDITGNADNSEEVWVEGVKYTKRWHSCISVPDNLTNTEYDIPSDLTLRWSASGTVSGFAQYQPLYSLKTGGTSYQLYFARFTNFYKSVRIKPYFYGSDIRTAWSRYTVLGNPIMLRFMSQRRVTSSMLKWLNNVDCTQIEDLPVTIVNYPSPFGDNGHLNSLDNAFSSCELLTNLDFLSNYDVSNVTSMNNVFNDCYALNNISGLANWNVGNVESARYLFYNDYNLKAAGGIFKWKLRKCQDMSYAFAQTGLINTGGLGHLEIGFDCDSNTTILLDAMFQNCLSLEEVSDMKNMLARIPKYNLSSMFALCSSLRHIEDLAYWHTANVITIEAILKGCLELDDVSALYNWDMSSCLRFTGLFDETKNGKNINAIKNWDLSAYMENGSGMIPGTSRSTGRGVNPPDVANELNWPGVENLSIGKLFQTQYDRTSGIYKILTVTTSDIYQETPRVIYYTTTRGAFGGYDEYVTTGSVSIKDTSVTGSITFNFRFGSSLPNWYKQKFIENSRDYYAGRYPNKSIDIVYSYADLS